MQQLDSMERDVEAILFASGDPVELEKIAAALQIDEKTVKNLIERIRERYAQQRSPLDIAVLGDSFQMCTLPQYAGVIRAALALKRGGALSAAALEVLAIVAYNQPVTRAFVEQVRGVDCSSIVRSLVEKGLVEEAGRLNIPGKPISYRTTAGFLRTFGLEGLEQLPTVPDDVPLEEGMEEEGEDRQVDGQIELFDGEG